MNTIAERYTQLEGGYSGLRQSLYLKSQEEGIQEHSVSVARLKIHKTSPDGVVTA